MNQSDHFDFDAADANRELQFQYGALKLELSRTLWSHFVHPDAREPDEDEPDEEQDEA